MIIGYHKRLEDREVIPIGDIGKTKRKIELEPLSEPSPIQEPSVAPAIPAPSVPVREPEKVPA